MGKKIELNGLTHKLFSKFLLFFRCMHLPGAARGTGGPACSEVAAPARSRATGVVVLAAAGVACRGGGTACTELQTGLQYRTVYALPIPMALGIPYRVPSRIFVANGLTCFLLATLYRPGFLRALPPSPGFLCASG